MQALGVWLISAVALSLVIGPDRNATVAHALDEGAEGWRELPGMALSACLIVASVLVTSPLAILAWVVLR